jgi:nucleoside-diphosphate-sugar epimerase
VKGRVYNVGRDDENYRKLDLVEVIVGRLGRGEVRYVRRAEDPRDYRVSFERIRGELGFLPRSRVTDGVGEVVSALEERRFGDPFASHYANAA